MKSVYLSLLVIVFSLFFVKSDAENLPIIDRMTTHNGLSDNTIRCILQDTTGFLWFGSLNGLNRFDGIKIKTLIPESNSSNSLSSGKIKDLYEDSSKNIWIRTYSDVFHCYNPFTEKFIFTNKLTNLNKHNLIFEDSKKNIWLGSNTSGCIRVTLTENASESKEFSLNNKLLPSNSVKDIFEDSQKNIWIITGKGIRIVKDDEIKNLPANETDNKNLRNIFQYGNSIVVISVEGEVYYFDVINHKLTDKIRIGDNFVINKCVKLNSDKIVLTTDRKGVYLYNLKSKTFSSDRKFIGEFIAGQPNARTDSEGNVWINNFTGIAWMISHTNYKVLKLNLIPPSILLLIDEERFQFIHDRFNNIWITTYGNGLFSYNKKTGSLTHYLSDKTNQSISSNFLLSILLDKNDNIWVGTENMGINKLSFVNRNVKIIYPDSNEKVKNANEVRVLFEDRDRNIWVATKTGNLYRYDASFTKKTTLLTNNYKIYSIAQDAKGSVWLGTRGNGLIELKNGDIKQAVYYQNTNKPGSLGNNNVFGTLFDHKGRLWVATFGGGLRVKTNYENTEGFKSYFTTDDWIRFNRYIYEDNKGEIWLATSNGVIRFQPDQLLKDSTAFKHYSFNNSLPNSLSNPEVRYIFQDSKERIWFATAGGGINLFTGEDENGNGTFKVYKNKLGIANDNIMAIQEDNEGTIWVSTESGLHTFSPETNLFRFYKFSDDFSSNIYSETAGLTLSDGRMCFGSLNGFYLFNPKDLKQTLARSNKVTLTGFFIYDSEAKIGEKNAPLKKSIAYSKKIVLKASDKVFHIEFANLDFHDPKANQFMFMLENYEKRWNTTGVYNVATYRNVPSGKYIFRVKSVNNLGEWDNNETTLEIVIKPPVWRTGWAYLLYFIILAVLGYIAYKLIMKFYKLDNAVKVERQLTDYKLRFFTNISHEFRTPLTLIKGGVDTLNEFKEKMSEPVKQIVSDLDKNTSHMLRLIEQLLEFRKLQNNKQKLNLQRVDAVEFLKNIYASFTNVAAKSNIEYNFLPSRNSIPIYLDKNKVDKIVFNFLSNAFKFTHRGGKINLIAEADENAMLLRISVADNGIGIPREKQHLLFSRFMQINFSESGTGVGLSLVNEFAALHKGKVSFAENEGGGSVFTFELSLDSNIYLPGDFVCEQTVKTTQESEEDCININEFYMQAENETLLDFIPLVPAVGMKYKVLVIDDNHDIRDFLVNKLSPHFDVTTAEDGDTGFELASNSDHDLIICDVMMPGMNGFDLTHKLKEDFNTCHIPVILLTAYVPDEINSETIEAGADAYISKPFSMKHLLLQINKLIEKREQLHKHYAQLENNEVINNDYQHIDLPEKDAAFLREVDKVMEQHFTDAAFTVDDFAKIMHTGRTLFFKKIKYLTGYTPNEFIRVRRMKKAAELLKTYKYNVSEVAYMVGINDPFYFSKCFKAQFGCSPSRYLNS
jgi:signal transduction histidine kinase/ligand-binding sensor domain-containing protein/DNA-binding NarL/FixJ family response regulator